MKKINKLIPISFATLGVASLPIIGLTSCGKNVQAGNLMEEYTPSIKQRARSESIFDSPSATIDTYLDAVNRTPEIFAQDLKYTLSRGLPQYIAYVSEYCEIKEQNFNMEVENISVTSSDEKKQIEFDLTIDVLFDYTGTKQEEMIWYDLGAYRWDTKIKAHFVFDFDSRTFDNDTVYGRKSQMTTYAGATQFGISEINSTVKLLSETGSYTDINGIKHKVDSPEGDPTAYHFIMPNEAYWNKKMERNTYLDNYKSVYNLWFNHPGLQVVILMFKYYMPSNTQQYELVPNTLDFGCYHFGQATLKDLYTLVPSRDKQTYDLYGFNLSLDSINILDNLKSSDDFNQSNKTLTLPKSFESEEKSLTIKTIANNAFNGNTSDYTNIGIPLEVENLIIPSTYTSIGDYAFCKNTSVKRIKFEHDGSSRSNYPSFGNNAFNGYSNLTEIDMSSFDNDVISELAQYASPTSWENVHLGNITPADLCEGTIYLPNNWKDKKDDWKNYLHNLGFNIFGDKDPVTEEQLSGWKLSPAE